MNELINHYRQQYDASLQVNIDWLNALRLNAWHNFTQLGFPQRRDEEWKYTNVMPISTHKFQYNTVETQPLALDLTADVWNIVINQGQIQSLEQIQRELPNGVIIDSLHQALINHPELVKPCLGQIAPDCVHGFTALNTALMSYGIFIYVPKEVALVKPVKIIHHGVDNLSQQVRHCIIACENSQLDVIEVYQGQGCYFTNSVTEISACENAIVNHYKLQNEALSAYHIGSVYGHIQANATINSHSFSFGGAIVRSDTNVDFLASGGHCTMNGLYCVAENQHVDHHTLANHQVSHCSSDEFYKGILDGNGKAVFNGKVIVAKQAQKTNASQQNKNLLLSKKAQVNTKPQLEIFADDVKCAHGATVGQLDENALFYLQSRGLSPQQAQSFLIEAFVTDRINCVTIESLKNELMQLVNQKRVSA